MHNANDSARIISPTVNIQGPACVLFWYHMYGADVNRLNMYSKVPGTSRLGQPYWTRSGTKGDRWLPAQVEFTSLPNNQVGKKINSIFCIILTLKAPIMTAADNIHKYFFIFFFFFCFRENKT